MGDYKLVPVAWYLPGEGGCDSQFRDHATVKSCTGNPWAGWQPLYAAPQPAPDVSALVDALERVTYCNEVGFLPESVQQAVSDALAAYRKGGRE